MKSFSAFGGVVPIVKGALLGLAGLGAVALIGGAMVGGTMVLGATSAPERVEVAALMPDDLKLPTIEAPEVEPSRMFTDAAWDVSEPAQPAPVRARRPMKANLGSVDRGDGSPSARGAGLGWCGKNCAWENDPEPFSLSDLGPREAVDRRLARQAAVIDAAAAPANDTPRPSFGQIVREHLDEVRACWATHGLAVDPGLAGHLTLTLRVGGAGQVERAAVARSTLGVPAVDRCIERRAAQWRFPRTGQTTTQSFPLSVSVFGGAAGR